ncbi:MAG: 16S rRNA (adenine(1518)-N(6)/adenine(1519)-N(6))-dimethyltransferase RsmA [Spirochaetota bacterium]|nr:16S rRNA (adenine(1518)-N(6)/adenine(1519)-N(6))-dimethyltransferase RsmA [Spirochaetota bacterium]
MKANGIAPNRRFGQNFLISQGVREKIIGLLELTGGETIWEIGPGIGAMTSHLAENGGRLVLFEIDRRFVEYLRQTFGTGPEAGPPADDGSEDAAARDRQWARRDTGVEIVAGDVLKTWKTVFEEQGMADRIIGNLPYNSAAAIIASIIEHGDLPPIMVYTVQKEVGERMTAEPGSRDYSAFTVLCRFACRVEDCGNVSAGCFYPQPHVTSKIVRMVPRGDLDYSLLPMVSSFTRRVFASRRKTIRNNLSGSMWAEKLGRDRLFELLQASGIDPEARGESLSVESIAGFVENFSRNNPGV